MADPAAARLPKGVRKLLRKLSERHPTAIVSGRSVEKLIQWVNVKGLYFAGSHGFEITGPDGSSLNYTIAGQLLPQIRAAYTMLHERVTSQAAGMCKHAHSMCMYLPCTWHSRRRRACAHVQHTRPWHHMTHTHALAGAGRDARG